MRARHTLAALLLLFLHGDVFASPASRMAVTLVQPDGSVLRARLFGDEYMKILTSEDGEPIVQDEEGYYCYAYYDPDGSLHSTGYRVGERSGVAVRSAAGSVPYGTLYSMAEERRRLFPSCGTLLKSAGMQPKSKGASSVTVRTIVIPVQFNNLPLSHEKQDFIDFLNAPGYDAYGAEGSVKDYFDDQFGGRCVFDFDVSEIVSLKNNYRYYGKNENNGAAGSDVNLHRMVAEACIKADEFVDFSRYDNDGDGVADNVMIIYSGGDEASGAGSDHIWSQSGFLSSYGQREIVLDGVKIDHFACAAEMAAGTLANEERMAGIGTFCHEFSHVLGLPDFYDYKNIAEAFWGSTSIMDRGNANNEGKTPPNYNVLERQLLGISFPEQLREGRYSVSPVNIGGESYRYDTQTEGEYFLFEYRDAKGWDKYIGGSGMLIYHIDSSSTYVDGARACDRWLMKGEYANTINAVASHQCADIEEADPSVSYDRTSSPESAVARVFFPYGENDSFTPDSDPAFCAWNSDASLVSVSGIRVEDGKLVFRVYDNEYSGIPFASDVNVDVFQDAAIIRWSADTDLAADVYIEYGEEKKSVRVEPYAEGKYSITLENLSPSSKYTVAIFFTVGGINGKAVLLPVNTHQVSFHTPYIYLGGIGRNPDGSFPKGTKFPLRLYNTCGAASVKWTMDGKEIRPDGSGYYVPERSGVLRAFAVLEDGRTYNVMKRIEIR